MRTLVVLVAVFAAARSLHCHKHCICQDGVATCTKMKTENFRTFIGSKDNLETVIVRDSYIRELTNGTFSRQDIMKELAITGSYLRKIEEPTLLDLHWLEKLDLSNNKIEIVGSPRSFLDVHFNTATAYLPNFVSAKYLRHVDLSRNNIKYISADQLVGMKYVQKLNLSRNNLPVIDSNYRWLMGIKMLDASFNRLTRIDNDFGQWQLLIEELYLSSNYLKEVPLLTEVACWNLRVVDVSFNEIESMSLVKIQNCRNISSINMAGNKLSRIKRYDVKNFPMLKYLDVGNNAIVEVEDYSFAGNDDLEVIHASRNKIQKLNDYTLIGLKMLRILDFSNNDIDDISKSTFGHTRRLHYIMLDNNKLYHLPPEIFVCLGELKMVFLRNNQLTVPSIDWFYSLNGQFYIENDKVVERKQAISANIYGTQNPWICDCKIKNFVDWQEALDRTPFNVECSFPKYYRGVKLNEIESANLRCDLAFILFCCIYDYFLYVVIISSMTALIFRYYYAQCASRTDCENEF